MIRAGRASSARPVFVFSGPPEAWQGAPVDVLALPGCLFFRSLWLRKSILLWFVKSQTMAFGPASSDW